MELRLLLDAPLFSVCVCQWEDESHNNKKKKKKKKKNYLKSSPSISFILLFFSFYCTYFKLYSHLSSFNNAFDPFIRFKLSNNRGRWQATSRYIIIFSMDCRISMLRNGLHCRVEYWVRAPKVDRRRHWRWITTFYCNSHRSTIDFVRLSVGVLFFLPLYLIVEVSYAVQCTIRASS